MNQLIKYCNKDEKTNLLKNKEKIKAMQEEIKPYGFEMKVKDDLDYFYLEAFYESFLNKQAFERVFILTHHEMIDYWETLNYQEKKLLMNVEINKLLPTLKAIIIDGEKQYIPLFDKKMNAIYESEMTLFELKQYASLMKDFKEQVILTHLSFECIHDGFCSLTFVQGNPQQFTAFCRENHRLYFFEAEQIKYSLGLKNFEDADFNQCMLFIELVYANDELAAMQFLVDKRWVGEATIRKFEKLMKKMSK